MCFNCIIRTRMNSRTSMYTSKPAAAFQFAIPFNNKIASAKKLERCQGESSDIRIARIIQYDWRRTLLLYMECLPCHDFAIEDIKNIQRFRMLFKKNI